MKGLFQCPPRAAPWVHSQSAMRPVRAKALYNTLSPTTIHKYFGIDLYEFPKFTLQYYCRLSINHQII